MVVIHECWVHLSTEWIYRFYTHEKIQHSLEHPRSMPKSSLRKSSAAAGFHVGRFQGEVSRPLNAGSISWGPLQVLLLSCAWWKTRQLAVSRPKFWESPQWWIYDHLKKPCLLTIPNHPWLVFWFSEVACPTPHGDGERCRQWRQVKTQAISKGWIVCLYCMILEMLWIHRESVLSWS